MLWAAALTALFAWWASTGAILYAVRRADRSGAHGALVLAATPLLAAGLAGLVWSLPQAGLAGVYAGFLSALAVWGWVEVTFLTGAVTGPSRAPCPPGLTGAPRLWRAWSAVGHHELLLTFGLLVMVILGAEAANPIGPWTYALLYGARIAAKVNLFLGAPRINLEFMPTPLAHLSSYFRRGPVTLAFPLAVTALTGLAAWLLIAMAGAEGPRAAGYALLAALAALALAEHWLMVVPLPDAALWRWMLPETPESERETS